MAGYTAIAEAGQAIVALLRREMTPEPVSKPELIGLGSPFEPEDFQLTVHLLHLEESAEGRQGFIQEGRNSQRMAPLQLKLTYLVTAHSKAPVTNRAEDEYRILGRAVQALRDNPAIDSGVLSGSLAQSGEALLVSISKLTMEALQRMWNSNSKPYKASFAVNCTVSIESTRTRTAGRVGQISVTLDEKSAGRDAR